MDHFFCSNEFVQHIVRTIFYARDKRKIARNDNAIVGQIKYVLRYCTISMRRYYSQMHESKNIVIAFMRAIFHINKLNIKFIQTRDQAAFATSKRYVTVCSKIIIGASFVFLFQTIKYHCVERIMIRAFHTHTIFKRSL